MKTEKKKKKKKKNVAYQTNGSGAESTMQAYILCPYKHPRPLGGIKRSLFLN